MMNFFQVVVTVDRSNYLPVDPMRATPPWFEALQSIQQEFIRIGLSPVEFEAALQLVEIQFAAAAHLLYKRRWSPRHRVPYSKQVIAGAEPLAAELHALCNLAIELHAVRLGPEYLAALDWLGEVVKERKLDALRGLHKIQTNSSAKNELRQQARAIRDGRNPIDCDRTPHTYRLVDRAIEAAKGCDKRHLFRKLLTGSQTVNGTKVLGLVSALEATAAALNQGAAEVVYFDRVAKQFCTPQSGRQKPKTIANFPLKVE